MVYETDFYTTRRPYRVTPSLTTYSVSTPALSRQVRILPGLGKVHVVHTYDRIVPYVGHKRLTVVTSNPMVYKVRSSVLNREFDRIENKYRPATYMSALNEYLNSRSAVNFDDETRLIKAETASLLRRIHSPIPRTPRALPLPYLSRYDEYPSKAISDNYIYRMLVSSPKDPRVISYTTYYTEPVKKYFGLHALKQESNRIFRQHGQLSCISFAGDKSYPRRRNVYVYEDPVRNDIQLLSYYISKFRQERPAVSIKELPSAQILSPLRPTRIFAATREERAQKRQATAAAFAAAEISRPIRSPADGEAIKKAQERKEEERLAAEKAAAGEAARKEAARLAEIARQEELAAQAAAEKAAELERQAELARQEELAKQAEIERVRKAEAERARLEEEKRLAELARAEEERQQLLRLEEIARQAEAEREAELARQAEELAELARQEAELAELAKQKEEEEARRRQEEEEAELARQEAELAELERQEKELAELARQEAELAEQAKLEAEQARKEADEAAEQVADEPALEPEESPVAEEEATSAEGPAQLEVNVFAEDIEEADAEPVVDEPKTPEVTPEEEPEEEEE